MKLVDKVFGSYAKTQEVYEVAVGPVTKAYMEGINGTVFDMVLQVVGRRIPCICLSNCVDAMLLKELQWTFQKSDSFLTCIVETIC
ncbi:hypothetical protein Hdeb2414_s0010g00342031 [Helianthus debilis subsp. tardiflorus]